MNRKTMIIGLLAISVTFGGMACSSPPPAAPAKPAAPAAPAKPKPTSTKPAPAPSKPPEQPKKEIPAATKVAVPADWDTYWDSEKGYQFEVPTGTKAEWVTVEGVDWFEGTTPSNVQVNVAAYKDKNASKEDLLALAKQFCLQDGDTDVVIGEAKELSGDYSLAEGSGTLKDGKKYKMKILVATDVTDNYIVILWTDVDKYDANKDIIDGIWGSFSMYSGGFTGES